MTLLAGFFANSHRRAKLPLIRQLLADPVAKRTRSSCQHHIPMKVYTTVQYLGWGTPAPNDKEASVHRMTILFVVATSALLLGGEAPTNGKAPTTSIKQASTTSVKQAPNVNYSREQLDRMRSRLAAQIAVHDLAEGAMRAPTPDELAALANNKAAGPVDIRSLKNGGVAVRGDQAQMDYLVAIQNEDGTVSTSHRGKAPASTNKGGNAHVQ